MINRNLKKNHNGFTVMEIILVVAIMGIMAAIAIPAFMKMLPGMRLNGAARQVMGDLMAARMKAVKLNRKTKVIFDDNHQYRICDDADSNGTVDDGEGDVETRNIQTEYYGVMLDSIPTPIIFQPRGTATNKTVTLNNSSGSKSLTVAITGRVKIQ